MNNNNYLVISIFLLNLFRVYSLLLKLFYSLMTLKYSKKLPLPLTASFYNLIMIHFETGQNKCNLNFLLMSANATVFPSLEISLAYNIFIISITTKLTVSPLVKT